MAEHKIKPLNTDLEKVPVEAAGQYVFIGNVIEKINEIIRVINSED